MNDINKNPAAEQYDQPISGEGANGQKAKANAVGCWWDGLPNVDKTDGDVKPEMVFEGIPAALTTRKTSSRWVNWRWEWVSNHWNKVPLRPNSTGNAKVNDAATWTTAVEAEEAVARLHVGIGYVLTNDDELVVFDLDNVIADDGQLAPWAKALIEEAGSYTELSPSGRGFKIFGLLKGYAKIHKTIAMPIGQLEIFHHAARYIIVTGRSKDKDAPLADMTAIVTRFVSSTVNRASPKAFNPFDHSSTLSAEGNLVSQMDVERALSGFWNPDDYDDWVNAALALHCVSWGKEVWFNWSATSQKFSAEECERKWAHTVPTGGITPLSILHRVPRHVLTMWSNVQRSSRLAEKSDQAGRSFQEIALDALRLKSNERDQAAKLISEAAPLIQKDFNAVIDLIHRGTGIPKSELLGNVLGKGT